MHFLRKALFVLSATPALAAAQFGPGQMPNTDYFPILLLEKKVQQDLHLSSAVAQQEQTLVLQMGMRMLPALQGAKSSGQMQGMFKAYQDLETKAVAPLNPHQKARLHQLTLQFYGPAALDFPGVASRLGLTPSQKQKISAIMSASGRQMMGHLPRSGSGDMMGQFKDMQRRQNEARAVSERQVNQVLTAGQRAKWNAIQGPKLPGITDFGNMFGM
jgi:hypothetical protein